MALSIQTENRLQVLCVPGSDCCQCTLLSAGIPVLCSVHRLAQVSLFCIFPHIVCAILPVTSYYAKPNPIAFLH